MTDNITILGLPFKHPAHFSLDHKKDYKNEIQKTLHQAKTIYAKSAKISLTPALSKTINTIKYYIPRVDKNTGLTDGYLELAGQLIEGRPSVFLVHGDPTVDEASTYIIKEQAAKSNIPVSCIALTPAILPEQIQRLALPPSTGLQILDATLLSSYHYPPLEPHRPALITSLAHLDLIVPLKFALEKLYPPSVKIYGFIADDLVELPLSDLDSSYQALFIPALSNRAGLTAFQNTIAHLRAPTGCPWDREQTHQSLRPYLLEETYEVLETLDTLDLNELPGELGDLLLQIVLHAQIGQDNQTFQMSEIIHKINAKMLRRHPHVFGDISVSGSDEVTQNWAAIKAQEKAAKGESPETPSVLDGVLQALPALAQALVISQKAVDVGFEWDHIDGVLHKLVEEAHEIAQADGHHDRASEIGDFLFTAVNLARKLNIDAETALRTTNLRFTRRFKEVEKLASAQNLNLNDLDKDTWQNLWQEAKARLAGEEKQNHD